MYHLDLVTCLIARRLRRNGFLLCHIAIIKYIAIIDAIQTGTSTAIVAACLAVWTLLHTGTTSTPTTAGDAGTYHLYIVVFTVRLFGQIA